MEELEVEARDDGDEPRPSEPPWRQRRVQVAAGGIAVVLCLLVAVLTSGGDTNDEIPVAAAADDTTTTTESSTTTTEHVTTTTAEVTTTSMAAAAEPIVFPDPTTTTTVPSPPTSSPEPPAQPVRHGLRVSPSPLPSFTGISVRGLAPCPEAGYVTVVFLDASGSDVQTDLFTSEPDGSWSVTVWPVFVGTLSGAVNVRATQRNLTVEALCSVTPDQLGDPAVTHYGPVPLVVEPATAPVGLTYSVDQTDETVDITGTGCPHPWTANVVVHRGTRAPEYGGDSRFTEVEHVAYIPTSSEGTWSVELGASDFDETTLGIWITGSCMEPTKTNSVFSYEILTVRNPD